MPFARLLFACLSRARVAQAVGLFTALRLFATFGDSTIGALVIAARLLPSGLLSAGLLSSGLLLSGLLSLGLLPGLLLSGLLSLGLLPLRLLSLGLLSLGLVPGVGLPAALFFGAALGLLLAGGLLAPGVVAGFRLSPLLAGATLRCLLARGLLALFARAAFGLLPGTVLARGLLAGVLAAPGILAVIAALGLLALLLLGACLVVLLVLLDAFAVLVIAGRCRRCHAHGQDRSERDRTQDLSGGGEFHVGHLQRHANVSVGPKPTLRVRDEWALRPANGIQRAAWVTVYRVRVCGNPRLRPLPLGRVCGRRELVWRRARDPARGADCPHRLAEYAPADEARYRVSNWRTIHETW
ncbi:hypothetical protein ACTJIL_06390 [Luteimonas sp. 22616]|uniref:hypothetical protein n=1 Tax=Luteimonas sp. 22616 TaxID=3453951 RepID=UPI003F87087F